MRTALIDYKPIPGFDNYVISELGAVFNTKRQKFKAHRKSDRYLNITLYQDGKAKIFNVHRLVAKVFIPNPEGKLEVNHIDGDTFNNHVSNLEWCTRKENAIHSTQILKKNRGEDNAFTKLKEADVLQIKKLLSLGYTQTAISKLYNVTNHAIHRIAHGYNWSWLDSKDRNTSCAPL